MSNRKKIVVIGSSNTDMVVKSTALPKPGETVLGGDFQMIPGGKGANQAVAAAMLDGDVTFIAKVGNDMFGQESLRGFEEKGIDTENILVDDTHPSGVALIMVDEKGENSISVALGANAQLSPTDIENISPVIAASDVMLIQLEIPVETVEQAVSIAKRNQTLVILNPAPAQPLSDAILRDVDIITPNQSEAKILTGVDAEDNTDARKAAESLFNKGVSEVIITMGSKGAYIFSDKTDQMISSIPVKAMDTTAAGDTFNGALAVALAEGKNIQESVVFANQAAAYSVTKMGAQTSAPTRKDLLDFK